MSFGPAIMKKIMLRIVDCSLGISVKIGGLYAVHTLTRLVLILDFSFGIIRSQSLGKVGFVINSSDDVNPIVSRKARFSTVVIPFGREEGRHVNAMPFLDATAPPCLSPSMSLCASDSLALA